MEQIRLIMLVESRIRGNVYVRFGGEFLKTSHSNMERRWELSLLQETVKIYEQGKKYYDALKSVNNLVKDARKVQQTTTSRWRNWEPSPLATPSCWRNPTTC